MSPSATSSTATASATWAEQHPGRQYDLTVRSSRGWVQAHVNIRRTGSPERRLKLLFLHGVGITSHTWFGVLDALGDCADCAAVDLVGFGHSTVDTGGRVTMRDQVEAVPAMLDALGWRQAVVVGHSMGGGSALGAALLEPRRVAGLVLVAAASLPQAIPPIFWAFYTPGADVALRWVNRIGLWLGWGPKLGRFWSHNPDAADEYVRALTRRSVTRAFVTAVRDLRPSNYRRYVARYRDLPMPVLVVHGGRDHLVPPEVARKLCQILPVCDLYWFERGGHMLHEVHGHAVADGLLRWIDQRLPHLRDADGTGVPSAVMDEQGGSA